MKPYDRRALPSPITLVFLGCLGAGGWLVFQGSLTPQPVPTTLPREHGGASARVAVPSLLGHDASASAGSQRRVVEAFGRIPLSFEANAGQTDSRVKFLSRGPGYTLFLTGNEAVVALKKAEARSKNQGARSKKQESRSKKQGDGESKSENRNSKTEIRKSKLENRKWRPEIWNWRLETRSSKIETGKSKLDNRSPKSETRHCH